MKKKTKIKKGRLALIRCLLKAARTNAGLSDDTLRFGGVELGEKGKSYCDGSAFGFYQAANYVKEYLGK